MNSKKQVSSIAGRQVQASNKENQLSQFSQGITKARKFTQNLSTQKDVRHGTTYTTDDKILNQRLNRTSNTSVNAKSKKPTGKLDDLYIIHDQKSAPLTNQKQKPTNIILNNVEQSNVQSKLAQKTKQPTPAQQNPTLNTILSPSNKMKKILEPIKPSTLKNIKDQKNDGSAEPIYKMELADNKSIHQDNIAQKDKINLQSHFQVFQTCSHVMKRIRRDYTMCHVFNRHKSCMLSEPLLFELPKTQDEVLFSQKTSRFFGSQYKIFLQKKGVKHELGTLKSNFSGSIYNFYPVKTDIIYFSILFDKVSDLKDNIRYTQIYINEFIGSDNEHLVDQYFIPYRKLESLQGLYKVNMSQKDENERKYNIMKFSAKLPGWSQKFQCYNLDFGNDRNKVMPSVKNAIFVDQKDKQVMKFYKSSHLTYSVSFQHPFSWIVAYGYSLATTDFKIATQ